MSNINTVALSGNLTRDPELRHTGNDFPIAKLGIAVNKSKKTESGEYEEVGHFFDLTVLGKFGELVARKLRKGDAITVLGELEYEQWETEGQKRSKVSVLVKTIDAQGFFRKDEDVPAMQSGGNTQAPLADAATTAAADDDIPF